MGAYATDFVEKVWPLTYRGSPLKKLDVYPSEGNFDPIATAGRRLPLGPLRRGEASATAVTASGSRTARSPATRPRRRSRRWKATSTRCFRGFDLDYPDAEAGRPLHRGAEALREGRRDAAACIILRLPNDHTAGTKVGKPTPTAYVADNDLALGRVVEAVSKSKFWKETAIFVVEDDAQNGPDHVDAHRTVALVVSPYTKRKHVDSTMYSTSEHVADDGADPRPEADEPVRRGGAADVPRRSRRRPDLAPYEHVVPEVDLKEKNTATAWGAKLSETFDLTKEDAVDDLLFNEVIWRSVKGAESPMPPPVRAAFVFPHLKKKDKDDDD